MPSDSNEEDVSSVCLNAPPEANLRVLSGKHPVRAWREHRGLTPQALGDAANISWEHIVEIEGGRPASAFVRRALAGALGVSFADLE